MNKHMKRYGRKTHRDRYDFIWKGTVIKRVETGTILYDLLHQNTTLGLVAGPLFAILSNPFLPSPRCYPLRSINPPTATGQAN